jgi:hypothetical protein
VRRSKTDLLDHRLQPGVADRVRASVELEQRRDPMTICSKTAGFSWQPIRWTARAVAAICVVAAPPASAAADPITYQFVVAAMTGPLAGQSSSGSVAFESSIIPAGGGRVVGSHLFTSVDFDWDGVSYTASNTQTSSLQFDSRGFLTEWEFGTACIANGGGCVVRLIAPGFQDWAAANISARHQPLLFEYGRPDRSFGFGTATLAATPEPATVGLLIAALGGLFAIRRGNVH